MLLKYLFLCTALTPIFAFFPFLPFSHTSITPLSELQMSSGNNAHLTQPLLLSVIDRISTTGPIRLVLASQSPRRREILDMMGLAGRYDIIPSPLDEELLGRKLASSPENITPQKYAVELAEAKAYAVVEQMVNINNKKGIKDDDIATVFILGSDTIVDLDGEILEKPSDKDDAVRMLSKLSSRSHKVHTSVAIYRVDAGEGGKETLITSFVDTANVTFSSLSEDDIAAYVLTGESQDKAGGYGIQGIGGQLVQRIEGDFFTIMGLPMHRVSRELANAISSF